MHNFVKVTIKKVVKTDVTNRCKDVDVESLARLS